jgi:CRP/FNR family cyclic AMP-dependent transcriptional regulator
MDIKNLFKHAEEREKYSSGDVIFKAGDPAQHMYVVLDGEIEVRVGDRVLNTLKEGELLGEMALIGDHKRSATAIAKTDCTLAPINERRFIFMVQQTPFFALHVMRVIADRLVRAQQAG